MTEPTEPTTPPEGAAKAAPDNKDAWKGFLIIAAVLIVVFAVCTGGDDEEPASVTDVVTEAPADDEPAEAADQPADEAEDPPADEPEDDDLVLDRAACTHWSNVYNDVAEGLLTTDEILVKVREVHDQAQYSSRPGIRNQSQALVRSAVADDGEGCLDAAVKFTRACNKLPPE